MELGEITNEISASRFAILFESNLGITCDTSILEINFYLLSLRACFLNEFFCFEKGIITIFLLHGPGTFA